MREAIAASWIFCEVSHNASRSLRHSQGTRNLFELLTSRAEENEIPIQINALARPASNDAATIQISRGGCATGLVTIPNRYMHSPVEVVEESDLHHAAKLIAEFLRASGTVGLTLRPYRPEWNLAELYIRNAQAGIRAELDAKG